MSNPVLNPALNLVQTDAQTDAQTWRPAPRALALGLCAVALLSACSSTPPPRFHSLMSGLAPLVELPAQAVLAWQLAPVTVPAQVDQPQFVVRRADDTLVVLEQERWIAPLQDELRAALAERLSHTLGSPGASPSAGRKDWRVAVEVSRFDSAPGRTLLVLQWSVSARSSAEVALRCQGRYEQTVAADMAAIAQGHRLAVQRLAAAMAPALLNLDAAKAAACG